MNGQILVRRRVRALAVAPAAVLAIGTIAACGGSDSSASSSGGGPGGSGGLGSVQTFTAVDLNSEGQNATGANTAAVVAATKAFPASHRE